MNIELSPREGAFQNRHIGPNPDEISAMLEILGIQSVSQLINETIPSDIKSANALNLPAPLGEHEYLTHMSELMSENKIFRTYIGAGYYNTLTPTVILRNILENPGWYTAYTPYQAEIAQGRLEALINFQTMVIDLTEMEIANASLLDEGTAAAEAMSMFYSKPPRSKKAAETFLVDENTFPQTIDVLKTRASGFGINLRIEGLKSMDLTDADIFGIYIQNPGNDGSIKDHSAFIAAAHEADIQVAMGVDLLSLTLLKSPGAMGADVAIGSSQRFGVPLGYGGPHAAFMACKESFKRQMPGRIIGSSLDVHGNIAYRMALQTREQHIRREKATSNICTAQVLLAVMAGMYGVYHGPDGLRKIANRVAGLAHLLSRQLEMLGLQQVNNFFFDTIKMKVGNQKNIRKEAEKAEINFRYFEDGIHIGISIDETTTEQDIEDIINVFVTSGAHGVIDLSWRHNKVEIDIEWTSDLIRVSDFMTHEVFHKYHSEHEMLRYMKRLENKDLSLTHSMIALGSCTMKLNATSEMIPVTWSEMGQLHPFAPSDQVQGYRKMLNRLSAWLCEITGFAAISLQPNSGAQGEYAGLMTIRAYHESRGDQKRNIALIPSSAHGTNPASAVMAGQKVVIVNCDEQGNIDIADLKTKAIQYADTLSALMITYPSTHGVYEEGIKDICNTIHEYGGQVYMDGANMNAQVGLTNPGLIGADVCHLNLHKTFCIPHGGGGPGVGPIGVASQLAPFLPGNPMIEVGGNQAINAISSAPYGSASICAISYGYIAMMGPDGLKAATELAILNANYMKQRLQDHYPVLYTGPNGRCAHEMIIDCRAFKKTGIEVADLAKRLMDYGYHAPTVSFPVAGTMMIEPTESETKEEMDKFCDAMIQIRKEVQSVIDGDLEEGNNPLVNAPHTINILTASSWDLPYSREEAAFPLPFVRENKFWPAVGRIDNAHGDRNLICTCAPISAYVTDIELAEV
ncbi:MAG: glycine dehydrogenase [Saprospiraceae bacterium]|jgi:glycine dehydrogenase